MTPQFNRGTGLLVIDVAHSNPNGDPDTDNDPRILEADARGLITPVSFKRKLRDLMEDQEGAVRMAALQAVGLASDAAGFEILESRGRDRKQIGKLNVEDFRAKFWDGRVFGNTFLEEGDKGKFISTGVVQFAPGISLRPVEIQRLTMTSKSGVQEGKDRGMAPLAWRVVRHGVYVMPFFVNASAAKKSGCTPIDIEILKFLIPHAYAHTASNMRANVQLIHAWYGEHQGSLGSCPDPMIIRPLTPKCLLAEGSASTSVDDYEVPANLTDEIRARLSSIEDLCLKNWSMKQVA